MNAIASTCRPAGPLEAGAGMSATHPPLVTLVMAGAAAWWLGVYPMPAVDAAAALGGTLASVGATMLGFMLAALAVLASINHTHLVNMMRTTGHYHDLLVTLFTGCALFLLCTMSGFLLVFNVTPRPWLMAGIVGLHASALVSIVDIGRKFWMVLVNLRPR